MRECDEVADSMLEAYRLYCKRMKMQGCSGNTIGLARHFVKGRMPRESEANISNVAEALHKRA